ncbi:hypothetical protein SRS16CHR_02592 [Variovorax sp. SRS16]|uniref:type II toxin-antitoxin system HicB family antitoxin n=1 Tax=Variovorax sp. SRS16 TaxID=282217 RepID=UPI0013169F2E|nr:hypothetical protein [Variovorax sp. SRS16]VTU20187.1 hypothetical protein SRS16CHR_02592 [Variovorax sp. SRS16]
MPAVHEAREIVVNVYYSQEARGFWAESPDLNGLAASGDTRAEVEQEARWAAETIYEYQGRGEPPNLVFRDAKISEE